MTGGGTKLPRSSPCSNSSHSHAASPTSVLRPGRIFTCRALTSSSSNPRSSSTYQTGFQYCPVASITTWVTPWSPSQSPSAERLVGADLLAAPAADGASGHAGAGDDLVLTHVKPSAALVDHLHYRHLLVVLVRCPAGPTESTMLKVVLAANSSRCREGPRISLNNGLSRTKESRAWPGMPDSHPSRRPSAMRV